MYPVPPRILCPLLPNHLRPCHRSRDARSGTSGSSFPLRLHSASSKTSCLQGPCTSRPYERISSVQPPWFLLKSFQPRSRSGNSLLQPGSTWLLLFTTRLRPPSRPAARLQARGPACRVSALALQRRHILRVLAIGRTVLFALRRNALARQVRTLRGVCHPSSWGVLQDLLATPCTRMHRARGQDAVPKQLTRPSVADSKLESSKL